MYVTCGGHGVWAGREPKFPLFGWTWPQGPVLGPGRLLSLAVCVLRHPLGNQSVERKSRTRCYLMTQDLSTRVSGALFYLQYP